MMELLEWMSVSHLDILKTSFHVKVDVPDFKVYVPCVWVIFAVQSCFLL